MATHEYKTYHIDRFWDDEFKTIKYHNEPFNDPVSVEQWISQGFPTKVTGDMCDMKSTQPLWNQDFIIFYTNQGWKDIGTSYYRMGSGTVMPTHSDLYKSYINKFNLHGMEHTIRRALIFLEDWRPGHYLDCMGKAFVHWHAGDVVEWAYDTPHSAANVGFDNRYTLQITGHV